MIYKYIKNNHDSYLKILQIVYKPKSNVCWWKSLDLSNVHERRFLQSCLVQSPVLFFAPLSHRLIKQVYLLYPYCWSNKILTLVQLTLMLIIWFFPQNSGFTMQRRWINGLNVWVQPRMLFKKVHSIYIHNAKVTIINVFSGVCSPLHRYSKRKPFAFFFTPI